MDFAARLPAVALAGSAILAPVDLVRSKRRVADHGEVFTPPWLVEDMLDLADQETERIDARFLEPACGSGNFLVPVLRRKLAAVERRYAASEFEKRHHALVALMCVYGIELLADNVAECRDNLFDELFAYLGSGLGNDWFGAARVVVETNIVHGDALAMKTVDGEPVVFAEWGYLGRGGSSGVIFALTPWSRCLRSRLIRCSDSQRSEISSCRPRRMSQWRLRRSVREQHADRDLQRQSSVLVSWAQP